MQDYAYSPTSSPSLRACDSSPPSSPSSEFFLEVYTSDPFAGSNKSTRPPPLYEKKRRASLSPPSSPALEATHKKSRYEYSTPSSSQASTIAYKTDELDDESVWDIEVSKAFEYSNGNIDLTNKGLTTISRDACDSLSKFFVTSEAQESAQLPSMSSSVCQYVKTPSQRVFHRTNSTTGYSTQRQAVMLQLGSNMIAWLPPEIFDITRLTILSLPNNKLKVLPAEIALLVNLQSLDLRQNQLEFLPSEILSMRIRNVVVFPNPFIKPPDDVHSTQSISEVTTRLPNPIPLFEMCLRLLFTPDHDSESLLRSCYQTPLGAEKSDPTQQGKRWFAKEMPRLVHNTLLKCDSGSVYVEPADLDSSQPKHSQESLSSSQQRHARCLKAADVVDYEEVTGIGKCPSPQHDKTAGEGIFVMHAEERFTWETHVAGCYVGKVPIRWRGCLPGCLNFLAQAASDEDGDEEVVQTLDLGSGLNFDGE